MNKIRNTIEFLGVWEMLNNPNFKPIEFDGFKKQAGINSFTLIPKQWIEQMNAVGLISKRGRYGGTYAHKEIAFERQLKDEARLNVSSLKTSKR